MNETLTIERVDHTIIAAVGGELSGLQDTAFQSGLKDFLDLIDTTPRPDVVLDLMNVGYLGSMAIGYIIRVWKKISLRGGRLVLCNIAPSVLDVFRLMTFDNVWPIYSSRDEALTALRA